MSEARLYGVMAEFTTSAAIIAAARGLHLNGFRCMEAYTPFPIEGLDQVLHRPRRPWVPILVFLGALVGAVYSYFLQYWAAAIDYPINVGGRPYNSWPAFTVSSFEITVLFALVTAFFALLLFCRLPRLYHPVFDAPDFDRASQDRFFLCVEARDRWFDAERLRDMLARYDAVHVSLVPS
ncbi:MAG TPA: DUF3341 domain-containing protein [Stellaceae bacterium]|nr:DUF3341 domain-containing protein [Stellaceae bacterium]